MDGERDLFLVEIREVGQIVSRIQNPEPRIQNSDHVYERVQYSAYAAQLIGSLVLAQLLNCLRGINPNGLTHQESKKVALSIACFVPRSYARTLKCYVFIIR
jgi:hypothetical protein